MLNKVVLVGRITRDLELQHTNSGTPYVRFNIAVDRPFTNQNGERQSSFINCVTWSKSAENLCRFMRKGSLIGVDGHIVTGSYDKNGQTIYTTEVNADNIKFLESKGTNSQGNNQYQPNNTTDNNYYNNNNNNNFNQGNNNYNNNNYSQNNNSYSHNNNNFNNNNNNYNSPSNNNVIDDDDLPF